MFPLLHLTTKPGQDQLRSLDQAVLEDVHPFQGYHGQLPQSIPSQVHMGHGKQGAGKGPSPEQAEASAGLRQPVVLVAEQLLSIGGHQDFWLSI